MAENEVNESGAAPGETGSENIGINLEDVIDDAPPAPAPPEDTSPNVIFVGTRKRNGKEERLEEAPSRLIDGPTVFEDLPPSEVQLAGFYYERAAELCRAFPGLYKKFVKKGE